jgi:hypothetical protein
MIDKLRAEYFGYGKNKNLNKIIRHYRNGKDFTSTPREMFVIDLYGLTEGEARSQFPEIYQWLYERVKHERDVKSHTPDGAAYARLWWLFGKTRVELRKALRGLKRYISTAATAKHRVFQFYEIEILPDDALINIASDDGFVLGVLSCKIHVYWALATGGDLGGNTPRYNNSRCFQTFAFPNTTEDQKQIIRTIAENLDIHRKRQQALHPTLTITDMYNVMEKLRAGEPLNAKEQKIHEEGLVSILLQLHSELDTAVATAYGWPANLTKEEILEKLVALNKERAAEEARGLVRWLRPEYQNPQGVQQTGIDVEETSTAAATATTELFEWPKTLSEQAQAVQKILQQQQRPVSAADLVKSFKSARGTTKESHQAQLESLLDTFQTLGLLRKTEQGLYVR